MDTYNIVSQKTARLVTNYYSNSFGLATRLFTPEIRGDIYNIYGLVRIADEIVDTYSGQDAISQIEMLECEVYDAIKRNFSSNLIVHAFQLTANKRSIDKTLIEPFFYSMKLDTKSQQFDKVLYDKYIDGSAEVVGLMCLKVFVNTMAEFKSLEPGARALGSAFQKVNFLRDIVFDFEELNRFYFPDCSYENFDDKDKEIIVLDIKKDFTDALPAINKLPSGARPAVISAYEYYWRLLGKLDKSSVAGIKKKRIRVNNAIKLNLLGKNLVTNKLRRTKSDKK